jgi:hypothetical protein
MRIHISLSALRHIKPHEYLTRFVLGGVLSLVSAWLGHRFGTAVGGLFLAFPAIFPASATLVEKHEREKKQRAGIADTRRGRLAAAIDARGAALGSLGLLAFAAVTWRLLRGDALWVALSCAVAVWLVVSVIAWRLRELSIDGLAILRRRRSQRQRRRTE